MRQIMWVINGMAGFAAYLTTIARPLAEGHPLRELGQRRLGLRRWAIELPLCAAMFAGSSALGQTTTVTPQPDLPAAAAPRPVDEAVLRSVREAIAKGDVPKLGRAYQALAAQRAEDAIVPLLADVLKHPNEDIRIYAAETLSELGFACRSIEPSLTAALQDPCEYVRNYAATALGWIGPEAKRSVPKLLTCLSDTSPYVRAKACEALGRIGMQGDRVVPALIRATKDPDEFVRWQAVGALGEFGEAAASAAAPLAEILKRHEDNDVRWNAARPLARIDPDGQIAIPALTEALHDGSADVRRFSAMGLTIVGPKARAAAPDLLALLQDKDIGVRVAAAEALWRVDGNAKAAVPVLTKVVEQHLNIKGIWAADAISTVGPAAKDAVPALREMLTNPVDRPWRAAAARALGNIGKEASPALPELAALLHDKISETRAYAAGALWKIDRDPRALPTLIAELQRTEEGTDTFAAVRTVGELGPSAKDAVPGLTKNLAHRDLWVRQAALKALKQVAPDAVPKPPME